MMDREANWPALVRFSADMRMDCPSVNPAFTARIPKEKDTAR
jgi:hypothetical protein